MKCPSCNKFAALEMQEPEVNDLSLNADDLDSVTADYEVRIVRNSECCGDEMKESVFSESAEVPDEIVAKMKTIREKNPDAAFDIEEAGVETVEEGGGRYQKSYFGFTLTAKVVSDTEELGTFEITDKIAASGMDELA